MNVEIGAEAAQFPEKEYIKGIAVGAYGALKSIPRNRFRQPNLPGWPYSYLVPDPHRLFKNASTIEI
jgi:hypothetical protein